MQATKETQADIDELKKQFSALQNDISNLTQIVEKLASQKIEEATKTFEDNQESLLGEAEKKMKEYKKESEKLAKKLDEEIKENPLATLAIAFGAGIIAAKLLQRP